MTFFFINNIGGILNLDITPQLVVCCRNSRAKYHTDLKVNPRDEETQEEERARDRLYHAEEATPRERACSYEQ